jgi:hypothetical protein
VYVLGKITSVDGIPRSNAIHVTLKPVAILRLLRGTVEHSELSIEDADELVSWKSSEQEHWAENCCRRATKEQERPKKSLARKVWDKTSRDFPIKKRGKGPFQKCYSITVG